MSSTFIILLTSIAFVKGDTRFITAIEGEEALLDFGYPCDCSVVTLQYANRAPCYDSSYPNPISLPGNQELAVHNEIESNNCSLQLKINPVSRFDEGGHILTFYSDGRIYQGDTRIWMTVDYRLGKASCEWSEKNIADDWGSLLCKALAGSTPEQIICYQNGIRLPPKDTPREVGNILQQHFWVRYNQTAFCCANSMQEARIDRCACKDFVWDPSYNGNITDPCAAAPPPQESRQISGPTQSTKEDAIPTTLPPRNQTAENTPVEKKVSVSVYWGIGVVFSTLVLLIIVLCIVLASAFRKIRQLCEERNRINMKNIQNGHYTKVPTVEVQL